MITFKFTAAEKAGQVFTVNPNDVPPTDWVEVPLSLYLPPHLASDQMQAKIEEAVEKMVEELNQP